MGLKAFRMRGEHARAHGGPSRHAARWRSGGPR